ncbi:MAG: HNH endonuclease [Pseudomonadota bacterium]|nr:HNH endonuclease [Pseudomonadota bacterium]
MPLPIGGRTRIAKAAADTGFDLDLAPAGEWIGFASSHAPLRVWLTMSGDLFVVALSQANVWRALREHDAPLLNQLPSGACGARGAASFVALHRLLRRAFLLSRTLPDELWKVFEARTASLPRATEAERLVVQRVGQDVFRGGLLDYWEGRCAITGLAVPELLRASHIKPWAACELDAERLDVFNGFLLAAHLDAAFDAGFVTVDDDGGVVVSAALDAEAQALLGLDRPARIRGLAEAHRRYLGWHRGRVFKGDTLAR